MSPSELLEILYAALHEERGVVVETDDIDRLKAKLYAVRKDYEDLQILSFIISPLNPNQLWVVKRHEEQRSL